MADYFFAPPGLVASSSLAAKQYYVVKHASTAGEVKVATTAATDTIIGILQNDPAAGEAAEIAVAGWCYAAAEASINEGNPLTCSSTGRVKASSTDKHEIVGFALEASSSGGDIIMIQLSRGTLSV